MAPSLKGEQQSIERRTRLQRRRKTQNRREGSLAASNAGEGHWHIWAPLRFADFTIFVIVQELPDGVKKTTLSAGEYAINPRGVWHTADVGAPCTALFITAGAGTEHRPR